MKLKFEIKYYKEVPDGKVGTKLVEVDQEEIERVRKEYIRTGKCTHIVHDLPGYDYNVRKCIICGNIDLV